MKAIVFAAILLPAGGCLPPLPVNAGAWPNLASTPPEYFNSPPADAGDVADAVWFEVPRAGEPGFTGGYLSNEPAAGLVLVLTGASTYYWGGPPQKARDYHEGFGAKLRAEGFRTWTLAPRECGTPWGGGDLADVLSVLDWLEAGGREQLGAQRVLIVGYSNGGTLAYLAGVERRVDAVVAASGLTSGRQLQRHYAFYQAIATLYPSNVGLCQLGVTLQTYGPPGAAGWRALDAVGRAAELRSPMLAIHGEQDFVFYTDNARAFEQAYRAARDAGVVLPECQFHYVAGLGHFDVLEHPQVLPRIIAFLERHVADAEAR
ncbi:MAG: prolyl oligopeptidase family serine peptidase [Phycisphaerae bacterium]|nr:prolyl oligopeptidase family serine peptidase [Phycisphaerae bacterium]MCZ2401587.1 prolyl oligopeptidase family serine peptidase [Phycisphaerae bacterium]NUQ50000.1 prolyl oligopeptidase family serine peptidase [Phycisphaerae bacterium]